ncbi:sensor histidine kinase [Sinosporangium siamense]|uniref:Oxygen sensor histidine kinase NreB n=1 Tax=Sinosporangium siamense TaxID=1367973 RepID=A0A919REF9_9ACTN|nr:sensor histidine kinase [Sinosporangium siamense]GII92108.1 hypothetical protein Ssi02_23390 [Sinosporangium siamense]
MNDEETRWLRAFHLLFFACLTVVTGSMLLGEGKPAETPVTLALTAVMGGWYAFFVARHPPRLERLNPNVWHLLVLLTLLYVLIKREPVYQTLLWGMFALPYMLLPGRWGYAGAALLVVTASAADVDPSDISRDPGMLITPLGNVVLVVMVGLFANRLLTHVEQSKTIGVLEERARLAGEIHDTLAQGFSGVIAQLEAAEQNFDDPAALRTRIAQAKLLARENLREARRSVGALRPGPLEHAPLHEALRGVAERWTSEMGIPVGLTVDGEPRALGAEVETTVLRAAQEGLANAAKHSQAKHVTLTLTYMDDEITLDVFDDGKGFDPGEPASGYGLCAMRERAARTGGTVTVESAPGEGTALCLSIPCA